MFKEIRWNLGQQYIAARIVLKTEVRGRHEGERTYINVKIFGVENGKIDSAFFVRGNEFPFSAVFVNFHKIFISTKLILEYKYCYRCGGVCRAIKFPNEFSIVRSIKTTFSTQHQNLFRYFSLFGFSWLFTERRRASSC